MRARRKANEARARLLLRCSICRRDNATVIAALLMCSAIAAIRADTETLASETDEAEQIDRVETQLARFKTTASRFVQARAA